MLFYPRWKQRLWYLFSFLAMLPLLLVGVAFMTLSLNLNGYVRNTDSPIYVHWLAQFAQPVSVNLGRGIWHYYGNTQKYYLQAIVWSGKVSVCVGSVWCSGCVLMCVCVCVG